MVPPGIRIVRLADRPHCSEGLIGWLCSAWPQPLRTSRAQARRSVGRRRLRHRLPLCLVALSSGGRLAGTVSLLAQGPGGQRAQLTGLFVTRAYRGLGIGSALCARVLAEATRLRIRDVGLYTDAAVGFYRRFGFREVETVSFGLDGQMAHYTYMLRSPLRSRRCPGV